jgi:hypothetical protein
MQDLAIWKKSYKNLIQNRRLRNLASDHTTFSFKILTSILFSLQTCGDILTIPGQKNRHQILSDLTRSYTYRIFRTIVSQDRTISWAFIFLKMLPDSDFKMPAKILQDSNIKKRIWTDRTALVWSYQFT